MANHGPAKKPLSQHQKAGTYRADRHGGGSLPVEVPPSPPDLNPKAQAFWNVITSQLQSAGLVSRIDGQALRLAADSWSLYLEAMDSIEEHGVVVESVTQYGSVLKANPACGIRAQAWKQVMDTIKQFGMTPSSRTGLQHGETDSCDDEEERVASILKLSGA